MTDTDIKELKDLILGLDQKVGNNREEVRAGFADLKEEMRVGFSDVNGKINTVNARLTSLESNTKAIADLAEKVGELKGWKQIAIAIFTATIGGVIGYFVKGGKM